MDFKVKQNQEPKHIKIGLVPLNTETLCLSETTEVLNETSVKISSKFLVQAKHLSKIPASFENNTNRLV